MITVSSAVVAELTMDAVTTVGTASLNWKYSLSDPCAEFVVISPGVTVEA
jgi:hypothetical protein